MFFAIKKNLLEREPLVLCKLLEMFRQVISQLTFGRITGVNKILDDEIHLLLETPSDDWVIPIQAEFHRLAREDFLFYVSVDQAFELGTGWRPLPDPREANRQ